MFSAESNFTEFQVWRYRLKQREEGLPSVPNSVWKRDRIGSLGLDATGSATAIQDLKELSDMSKASVVSSDPPLSNTSTILECSGQGETCTKLRVNERNPGVNLLR